MERMDHQPNTEHPSGAAEVSIDAANGDAGLTINASASGALSAPPAGSTALEASLQRALADVEAGNVERFLNVEALIADLGPWKSV